jgi:hypothetical protein
MVSLQDAFDNHVRGRLESSFGSAVATLIVASASNSVGTTTHAIERDEYLKLCEAIAADQRVRDMWGDAGADDTLVQWKRVAGA